MTTMLVRREPTPLLPARPVASAQRPDIQGLRAVAVLIVVAYHAGLPHVPGGFVGVDLFFVLSGFLITQLLLREIARTGGIDLREFWARRARRLLPVSALVLVSTMLAVRAFMSPLDRPAIGVDALWSALFAGNWRFAQQQTDYLASDRDPSPFLHYWSLGVEEQFYLVWPLVLVAVAVVWRISGRRSTARTGLFGAAFALVVVASLAYNVHVTAADQPYGFFGTPARAWQLAAGAMTALALPVIRHQSPRVLASLGAAGIVLFGLCVHLLDESGVGGLAYPSWLAVAPTLAGVLLIASGAGPAHLLSRMLSWRPLTYVGDLSYSLYLWHWPVLVVGVAALEQRGPLVRTALVLLALGLSVASHHLVENPMRRGRFLARRPRLSLAAGAALVIAVLPVIAYATQSTETDRIVVQSASDGQDQQAADLRTIRPSLEQAADDAGPYRDLGCHVGYEQTSPPPWRSCTFADRGSDLRVVVLGDSIAGAIAPAVVEAGEQHDWAVTVWAKSRCPVADVTKFDPERDGTYEECDAFRAAALREIESRRPDVVVLAMSRVTTSALTVNGRTVGGKRAADLATDGLERTVERLRASGIGVVLSDSPHRAPFFPNTCLAKTHDTRECTFGVNSNPSIMAATARRMGSAVGFVKANATVCPDGTCQPVVGDIVVYRDKLHFTRTFARSLSDTYASAVEDVMPVPR